MLLKKKEERLESLRDKAQNVKPKDRKNRRDAQNLIPGKEGIKTFNTHEMIEDLNRKLTVDSSAYVMRE